MSFDHIRFFSEDLFSLSVIRSSTPDSGMHSMMISRTYMSMDDMINSPFFVALNLSMKDLKAFVNPGLHQRVWWDIMQKNR